MSKRHLPAFASFLRRHSYVRELATMQPNHPYVYGGGMSGPLFHAMCTACQPTYDFIRALHHSIMPARSVFMHGGLDEYRDVKKTKESMSRKRFHRSNFISISFVRH